MNFKEALATLQHFQEQAKDISLSATFLPLTEKEGTITYIDGGNAEILGSNTFSLQLIRIAACTQTGNKTKTTTKEQFIFVHATTEGYVVEGYGLPLISFHDVHLSPKKVSPQQVAELIRRKMEIETASSYENAVLDGNLQQDHPLLNFSLYKGGAVAKTNEVTKEGHAVSVLLQQQAPNACWKATWEDKTFVRLHPASRYIFKVEGNVDTEVLVAHSSDPVFLGYPYGLIEADRHARISQEETSFLHMRFMHAVDNPEYITQYLNTINAHDVLDGKKGPF